MGLTLKKRKENMYLVNKPGSRIMKYSRRSIAKAKGVSIYAIHKAVQRGILDPTDLKSVAYYICGIKNKGE